MSSSTAAATSAQGLSAAPPSPPPPPWEVVNLLSHYLDPKTLATASCVCKPWSMSMSSDHLWKPLCLSHHPSLSSLRLIDPTTSYRRLFALGYSASERRLRKPLKPHISLCHLVFTIDIFHHNSLVHSLGVAGDDLHQQENGCFQFEEDIQGAVVLPESGEGLTVAWTVVLKGLKGVFQMMDCRGNGNLVGGSERWFSEELPPPGCCSAVVMSGSAASGLLAEVGLKLCGGEGKKKVEKVSLGVLSVLNWRYVSVEDGLRYLQHFLSFHSVRRYNSNN